MIICFFNKISKKEEIEIAKSYAWFNFRPRISFREKKKKKRKLLFSFLFLRLHECAYFQFENPEIEIERNDIHKQVMPKKTRQIIDTIVQQFENRN